MPRPLDFRSDTVTRPTDAMRRAMHEAEVGDDVFGEDPTIRRLEERTAELLGKEAALYVPSGTMSNQIALAVLAPGGAEVYCERSAHIFNYEAGAPALIARVQIHPLDGKRGVYTREQVEAALRPDDHHFPPSTLIEVENTSNRGGGTVWPLAEVRRLYELSREEGMAMHLDGARLWNAAVASGTPEQVWAQYADTVSVCFSKGLGAPVGSALVGPREVIEEAHRWRKRLGGGMRQAGIVAAGALFALENHRERLAEDHRRARRLAAGIAELGRFGVDPDRVDTNIVIVDLSERGLDGPGMVEALRRRGLHAVPAGQHSVRFVTHLDVGDEEVDAALAILKELYGT